MKSCFGLCSQGSNKYRTFSSFSGSCKIWIIKGRGHLEEELKYARERKSGFRNVRTSQGAPGLELTVASCPRESIFSLSGSSRSVPFFTSFDSLLQRAYLRCFLNNRLVVLFLKRKDIKELLWDARRKARVT
jgi:hypothetical protein